MSWMTNARVALARRGGSPPPFTPPPVIAVKRPSTVDDGLPRGIRIGGAWAWRIILFIAAGYLLLRLLGVLRVVVIPVVVALLLAALFEPAAAWLRRRGVNRSLAAGTVLGQSWPTDSPPSSSPRSNGNIGRVNRPATSCAGQAPAIRHRSCSARTVSRASSAGPRKMLLGTGLAAIRRDHTVSLEPGTHVIFYTDGLAGRPRTEAIDDIVITVLHTDDRGPDARS